MSERIGIVWNPSKIEEAVLRDAVADVFGDDAQARWYATTPDDPGAGMAVEALEDGCVTVIAAGGDGTVRAVAESVAGADAALGIVPAGTGNLLARNLDVPLGDPVAALERIRDADPRRIDLGRVVLDDAPPRMFAVMVGHGIDAQMLAETDDDLKDKAGWLAYVEAMGRALAGTSTTGASLTVDDAAPERIEAHTLLIGNCGMLQGGVRLLPDAEVDDGVLDLLLLGGDGVAQWLETVRSVVWDNGIRRVLGRDDGAVSTETAQHRQAARIRVELDAPQLFEIDGEEVGEASVAVVEVAPSALRVH